MPSVSGSGESLGGAFRNALAGITERARSSYDRVGWEAQFKQLFGTDRGYKALGEAGLSVQRRTLNSWLDGTATPSAQNQARIRQAYGQMRDGGVPRWVKSSKMFINGKVTAGGITRDRGTQGAALEIDLARGRWSRVEGAITNTSIDGAELTGMVTRDMIEEDLGKPSDGWGFPGTGYTVIIRR